MHLSECFHVLLNHGTLEGNTFPLIKIGHPTGGEEYHRLSEKGRFANALCSLDRLRALGNILAVCGVRVSRSSKIQGVETFTIAAQAPFSVGWYLERCECHLTFSDAYFTDILLLSDSLCFTCSCTRFLFTLADGQFYETDCLIGSVRLIPESGRPVVHTFYPTA